MTISPPPELVTAVAGVWSLPAQTDLNMLTESAEFRALIQYCIQHYDTIIAGQFSQFPFVRALRTLGAPCFFTPEQQYLVSDPAEAASLLHHELHKKKTTKIYLCPLDCAANIQLATFSHAEINMFTPPELRQLVNFAQLNRLYPHKTDDIDRLTRFTWLVIREEVNLDRDIPARTYRFLQDGFKDDYGAITPYEYRYPKAVEDAIFALLLAPWESWREEINIEWRAFTIPWVYTVENDIFADQPALPGAEILTWDYQAFSDGHGKVIDREIPLELPLLHDARLQPWLAEQQLDNIPLAMHNGLINEAARHHFVKAFLSHGIDEFLAHMIVIDACMGERHATSLKLKQRLAGLLGDLSVVEEMNALYHLRSEYVHGREMTTISHQHKNTARILSRRMLAEIVAIADRDEMSSRRAFLDAMQEKWSLLKSPA
ncbi:hypothetical protein A3780_10835 [Kosakonia radicincitans]|uniref:hypothetical protein n=1 Tax=Kosakonia TaxID=1330547 RepID=UPI000903302A|nr:MULTISPECIES: hypothetical protein [Kosakonia]APG18027.1 hypothetical protein A3780_10835 [Kosakonia radicincitans]NCF07665.1 hypothetical protein [Kosakonia sp. MH5]